MIEYMWLIQLLATLATGAMGWFLKSLWQRMQDLDVRIQDTRETLEARIQDTRESYVHKDDILVMKDELITRLNRIEDLFMHLLKKKDT